MSYELVVELLKYILPTLLVIFATYLTISSFFDKQLKLKQVELNFEQAKWKADRQQDNMPLRLQAYERLTLFLERANPQQLIARSNTNATTAPELQYELISGVREEFLHNITQQIYVSSEAWELIKISVEDLISTLNQVAKNLPSDASGRDLGFGLLNHYLNSASELPTQAALNQLKSEVMELFH
ncbi:MAG: hypothetical protein ACPGXL_06230 [Chitinophagales bacterium]